MQSPRAAPDVPSTSMVGAGSNRDGKRSDPMAASDYKIESIESAPFGEMSYVAWRRGQGEALVVDPGVDTAASLAVLDRHGLRLAAILQPHRHADPIDGSAAKKPAYPP